jgi:hypothetical protein
MARDAQLSFIEKITALYRFYIADSVVGDWKQFTDSIFKAWSDLFLQTISADSYNKFISECNRKVGFDVVQLRSSTSTTCAVEYSMTVQEQKDFIRKMENFQFHL